VWVTSFNGKIGVMDFNGRPIGKESDFPFEGETQRDPDVTVRRDADAHQA
jgi:hypothetical protein